MTKIIPKDWKETTLIDKKFFKILGSGIDKFEGEKHYLSTSSIVGDKIESIEQEITYVDRPSRANMQPQEGSVWFARMKGTLKVLEVDEKIKNHYILSTGFCGVQPKGVSSRFLKQVFLSNRFNSMKDVLSTGSTQQGVGNKDLDKIIILIPPEKEQEKIAEIMEIVDDAIDATNKIIEATQMIEKGIIEKIVHKGIGHKEFTQTEIGELPAHWDMKKLNQITKKIGDGLHATPNYSDEDEYYFINGNNLIEGKVKITEGTKTVDEKEYKKYFIELNKCSVLLSINGTIGNIAFYNNEKVILGKSVAYINCHTELEKQFIALVLSSTRVQKYFLRELTGTTIRNLSLRTIRNTIIPLPPEKEMNEIVNIAYSLKERIMIEKRKKKKLLDIKKGLAQQLLTGQIRVKVD